MPLIMDGNVTNNGAVGINRYSSGHIYMADGRGSVGIGRTSTANKLEVEGTASKTTAGDWAANSDRRIKTDIQSVDHALETISKLRPVTFKYTEEYKQDRPSIEDKYYYNFIAQEYMEVFPTAVKGSGEYLDEDEEDEILQLDGHNAQIVAIKAIQELKAENDELKAENDARQIEIEDLKGRLASIEERVVIKKTE